jgi:DNA-binding NtrC family response regulator
MLIEDDELVRSTLAETLADEGIEVDGLANAEDALILLGSGQAPDVLVADIDLGSGLSGLDLASIARERHPDVEVILISGTTPRPEHHPAQKRERFISKPFAPSALAEAIKNIAGKAQG